jgi:chromosome segregation ATPase
MTSYQLQLNTIASLLPNCPAGCSLDDVHRYVLELTEQHRRLKKARDGWVKDNVRLQEERDEAHQEQARQAASKVDMEASRDFMKSEVNRLSRWIEEARPQFKAITSDVPGLTGPLVTLFKEEG